MSRCVDAQACKDIGLEDQKIYEIQQAIAAVLLIGNINFGDEDDSPELRALPCGRSIPPGVCALT